MSEDRFRQNLDAVTRALGERAAQHPDPVAEAMARRIKVQSDFEASDRRARFLKGGTAAAIASVGMTLGILYFVWPPERKPVVVTQETRPVAEEPKVVAAVAPVPEAPAPSKSAAPASPEPPRQVAAVEVQPAPQPAPPPDSPPEPQAAPQPVPPPAPLARDEVREMQKRLLDFGFDAGPLDGNAGRLTQAALARYQQQRGRPQSSAPDRDALEQLRQDRAAPPVPEAPAPTERAAAASPEPPQQVAVVEAPPAPQAAPQPAPPPEPQATPQPVPPRALLARDEVREMQKRLLDFGFDPGPLDGNAGRQTQAALARYQQQRGQPQASAPDRDALEQLRQDPAPRVEPPRQVAQRPAGRSGTRNEPPPSTSAASQRSSGNSALEFLRSADANLTRWFNSLSH